MSYEVIFLEYPIFNNIGDKILIKNIKKSSIGMAIILSSAGNYCYSEAISFDSDRWEIKAQESRIETYLGKKSLFLGKGIAVVKDAEFTNGIIEYDIAISQGRGFFGVLWHLQDHKNYEEFYLRSHQSGNPDANQYTPVFHGSPCWQLYYGNGYGAPFNYSFDKWMHVKVIVSGDNAEVYIEDMDNPLLFVNDLKQDVKSGQVGFKSGGTRKDDNGAYYANFSYTAISNPPMRVAKQPESIQESVIMSWSISEAFDEKSLDGKFRMTGNEQQELTWKKLTSERSGLANISKVQLKTKGQNTVFAKISITSEMEQIKPLQFGYSDRVKVYFNGQLIYGGNNTYETRDYRYLGTIGFFDEVYLPLKKGKNELSMAVSESFGGWGVQAKFLDMKGISIK